MRMTRQEVTDPEKTAAEIIAALKSMRSERNREGMRRFGINVDNAMGVPMTVLRPMAKKYKRSQPLANILWASGISEARILAGIFGEADKFSPVQADAWVAELNCWGVCDQLCSNLLCETPYAREKAVEWAKDGREFVRRAGFALMAVLAVHDREAADKYFVSLLPLIREGAEDERNFVIKAVNWALRQIGKRNMALNGKARKAAEELAEGESKSARWAGKDAARELASPKTLEYIRRHRA